MHSIIIIQCLIHSHAIISCRIIAWPKTFPIEYGNIIILEAFSFVNSTCWRARIISAESQEEVDTIWKIYNLPLTYLQISFGNICFRQLKEYMNIK
jgi:hypothetical protein